MFVGIRKALVESEDQECPGCREKEISPTSLIPNRFLRSTVNTFKNETGYSKSQPAVESKKEPPVIMVDLTEKKSEEGERRKLSLDELPDDLFPHSPRKIDPESDSKDKEASGNEGSQFRRRKVRVVEAINIMSCFSFDFRRREDRLVRLPGYPISVCYAAGHSRSSGK